jgi:hypothetical protein
MRGVQHAHPVALTQSSLLFSAPVADSQQVGKSAVVAAGGFPAGCFGNLPP